MDQDGDLLAETHEGNPSQDLLSRICKWIGLIFAMVLIGFALFGYR